METKTNDLRLQEEQQLINRLDQISNYPGLEDLTVEVALGLGRAMRHKSHDCMSEEDYEDEYFRQQGLLEFLILLLQYKSKYNCTPDFSTADMENYRKGEEGIISLTESERKMIESRRVRNKSTGLVGGEEGISQHRKNLEKVFGDIKDEELLKTFRMLDNYLEADELLRKSIQEDLAE